jgi:hypothetical protein
MLQTARLFTAALVATALLTGSAFTAAASTRLGEDQDRVPVIIDALVLRPVGFGVMCLGLVTYGLFSPVMAVTRPTDMHRPFNTLVILPARFVFVDPLGRHPDRVEAEVAGTIH